MKKTEAAGLRLHEAARINTSLLTLRRCIDILSKGHVSRRHVPFRDSKLTRVLQNALGGTGRAAILCTVDARATELEEAMSTLRFATAAATVSNSVVASIQERSAEEWEEMITAAARTIQRLTSQLAAATAVRTNLTSAPAEAPSPLDASDLVCPLSGVLFKNPVVALDGRTYEKAAILDHFREHGDALSPVDGTPLESSLLIPNRCVAAQATRVRTAYINACRRGTAQTAPPGWDGPDTVPLALWNLDVLPSPAITSVCSFLTPLDVAAVAATCRRLYHEANASTVWQAALHAHFGRSPEAQRVLEAYHAEHPPHVSPKESYIRVWKHATMVSLAGLPAWLRQAIDSSAQLRRDRIHERKLYLEGTIPRGTGVRLLHHSQAI